MRCKNCGWDNPAGHLRCDKCNMPLDGSILGRPSPGVATPKEPSPSVPSPPSGDGGPIKGTIQGAPARGPYLDENKAVSPAESDRADAGGVGAGSADLMNCPKCAAPVREGTLECPYCLTKISASAAHSDKKPATQQHAAAQPSVEESFGGTIRRRQAVPETYFSLTKLEVADGAKAAPQVFHGNSQIVNRTNLEPGNKTITSQQQAQIEQVDGVWYLKNLSQLKSTFLRVEDDAPVALRPGCVILFGDREFVFQPEK